MPEALAGVLATPGLVWLILTISVAGIVRGFTGFGTALVFVPVAGMFLPPQVVVAVITPVSASHPSKQQVVNQFSSGFNVGGQKIESPHGPLLVHPDFRGDS